MSLRRQTRLSNRNFIYNDGNSDFLEGGYQATAIGAAIEMPTPGKPLSNVRITNNISYGGQFGFYYDNYGAGSGMQNSIVANNTFANTQQAGVWIASDSGHSGNRLGITLIINPYQVC
jgi:hypothetical protein